jgi:hypothetical protein
MYLSVKDDTNISWLWNIVQVMLSVSLIVDVVGIWELHNAYAGEKDSSTSSKLHI